MGNSSACASPTGQAYVALVTSSSLYVFSQLLSTAANHKRMVRFEYLRVPDDFLRFRRRSADGVGQCDPASDSILWASAKKIGVGPFLTISRNVDQFTSGIVGVGQCDPIGRRKRIRQCDPR